MNRQNDKPETKQLPAKAMRQRIAEIQLSACIAVWMCNDMTVRIYSVMVVLMYIRIVVLTCCRMALWKYGKPEVLLHCNIPVNQLRNNELYVYILNYSL